MWQNVADVAEVRIARAKVVSVRLCRARRLKGPPQAFSHWRGS